MNEKTTNMLLFGAVLVGIACDTHSRTDTPANSADPRALGYYGAMSLYRNLALWFGKRAMDAELSYWKVVA